MTRRRRLVSAEVGDAALRQAGIHQPQRPSMRMIVGATSSASRAMDTAIPMPSFFVMLMLVKAKEPDTTTTSAAAATPRAAHANSAHRSLR